MLFTLQILTLINLSHVNLPFSSIFSVWLLYHFLTLRGHDFALLLFSLETYQNNAQSDTLSPVCQLCMYDVLFSCLEQMQMKWVLLKPPTNSNAFFCHLCSQFQWKSLIVSAIFWDPFSYVCNWQNVSQVHVPVPLLLQLVHNLETSYVTNADFQSIYISLWWNVSMKMIVTFGMAIISSHPIIVIISGKNILLVYTRLYFFQIDEIDLNCNKQLFSKRGKGREDNLFYLSHFHKFQFKKSKLFSNTCPRAQVGWKKPHIR